ncbi:unnamed protein product [Linum tenue]|uniref:Uncharacterized protein n=1 Tax=Linum tenue TaxID=586396 RepID=A0AAV0RZQ6_9ROSI|nr:unnamed protein product [Linum tenue]
MGGGDKRPAQGGEGLAGDIRHGGGRSQSIRRGRPPIQGKQSQAQFPGKRPPSPAANAEYQCPSSAAAARQIVPASILLRRSRPLNSVDLLRHRRRRCLSTGGFGEGLLAILPVTAEFLHRGRPWRWISAAAAAIVAIRTVAIQLAGSTGSAVCLIAVDDFSTFGSRSISFSFFFLLCFISPAFRG